MNRICKLGLAALAVPALLIGCKQAQTPSTEAQSSTTSAPEAKPGLSAENGKLILPVIPGRPGVAYFKLRNDGDGAVALAAASIQDAARTEMHETVGGSMRPLGTVEISPGETVEFAQGGKHLMVFDLSDALQPGGTAELTLTFADGDKLSTPLAIERRGASDVAGMRSGDGH